jgi:hypothetical protein
MIVDLQYLAQNLNDSALTYNILDATASLQLAAARMDAMVAEVPPWREQQPWWHGAQPDEDMSLRDLESKRHHEYKLQHARRAKALARPEPRQPGYHRRSRTLRSAPHAVRGQLADVNSLALHRRRPQRQERIGNLV